MQRCTRNTRICFRLPQKQKLYLNILPPVTLKEIEDTISTLDLSKSVGPFGIPLNLLKILTFHISHPLGKLVNESFLKVLFPPKPKIAKVIPLIKQGDLESISNYRPIFVLPIFSKLYEKVMYKRLYCFVTSSKPIHPLQLGFQENHSVDNALISITEAIQIMLDNKNMVVVCLLTFKKPLILLIIIFYSLN